MLPQGFLGTRGDVLMDLVVLSFVVILPVLAISWRAARRRDYRRHRLIQISLVTVLAIAVGLFEVDLKLSGGIFELTRESSYAGTGLLNGLIFGHTMVAVGSVLVWVPLIILSLRRFPNPPVSNAFGPTHRLWGRTGMLLMMTSGMSAIPLYYVGFAL
jgi:putative membrane protein